MSWTGSLVELCLLTSSHSAMVSHPPPAPALVTSMVALTHTDTPPSFLSAFPEQPQHNWIPPTQPTQPSDTLLPAQQPVGHAAASAAAAAVNGSLGGGSMQQLPSSGPANAEQPASDPLSSQLAGMSKQQLYDLLSQMKVKSTDAFSLPPLASPFSMQGGVEWSMQVLIQTNHAQARAILVANPQLTKGLFQVRLMPPTGMQERPR